jgi:hypothetical protein
MNNSSKEKAAQGLLLCGPAVSVSTRNLMAYWVLTEKPTAANTAPMMAT